MRAMSYVLIKDFITELITFRLVLLYLIMIFLYPAQLYMKHQKFNMRECQHVGMGDGFRWPLSPLSGMNPLITVNYKNT